MLASGNQSGYLQEENRLSDNSVKSSAKLILFIIARIDYVNMFNWDKMGII